MKKSLQSLIFLLAALMVPIHALAITDGVNYEPVNGIKIVNQWIFDRVHSGSAYSSNAICSQRARTATMDQGIIYVARSEERSVIIGNDTILQSVIHRFSAADGSQLEDLPLTLDGVPYGRFLGVTSIGKDNFHHIWVAPMTNTTQQYVPVYMVNTETGELTLVVELDKGVALNRTDYLDVIGDLSREEAECNIMTVSGSTADPGFPTLYRMHADQGGEWEGGFDGVPYMDIINFYPDTKTGFSLAPTIKMIEGQDEISRYSGSMFFIDCFDAPPVLYDINGSIVDTFDDVDPALWPKSAPNGCIDFNLDGHDFFVYVIADMNGSGNGCQANICELGEGRSLSGMTKYWKIPADSLGKVNDTGLRLHCFDVEYGTDSEGNEEVTLFTFKVYNGMAVYKLSVIDESTMFVIDGIRYKKIGQNQVQVERLVANTGVVEIPETVTYEGMYYQVTSIESRAFKGYSLDLLVLPITITSIDPHVFMDCTLQSLLITGDGAWQCDSIFTSVESLYIGSGITNICGMVINADKIFSYASTPPVCDESTFSDYGATLHVPATSFAAYFTADYWCNFGNIVGDAVEPLGVALNKESTDLLVNDLLHLTATVTPTNATPNTVTWNTTDATVAIVDDGLVTVVGQGECDIIASCLNKKAMCHITAGVIEVTSISLSQEEAFLEVNEQVTLTATVTPDNATYGTVNWRTSNSAVAVVDANGMVRAVGTGECDIIATCGEKQAVCHVIVVPQKIYITLDKHTANVLPNHMVTLNPSVTPVSTELKVTSSDPTIAAARIVNGVVQVVGISEGTVAITVGSVDGYAIADTCQVTVYTEIGDVNCDGFVNISDVTDLIDYLLSGNDNSVSQTNADCDKDGKVNIADVTTLIDFLLSERWPWEPDHEWVDLGLPSGILWATCNVGANAPEEYGDYFAWGKPNPNRSITGPPISGATAAIIH